ncbi:methylenetetrahydrofolate reductase [Nannochloropsis gaditana]|uniref:Methylenetetrahydrofolate reductase n=1 Tax=Nannochloropsis gaditana TaxID=72520 RepID=W7TSL1_9STRA|nr:methylenetetrahydrofolate reductase [Nannochloropsis gaditana]
MKIIDKIKEAEEAAALNPHQKPPTFCSFEFFPPKTAAGVENLYMRIDRLASLEPLYIDITWGAGGSTADLSLQIAATAQRYLGQEVLMHLTCTNLDVEALKAILNAARQAGIQNILALRGDPPKGASSWESCQGGLGYAIDLVRLIREEHGDHFCVAVGGHPEGHHHREGLADEGEGATGVDLDKEIEHLKAKIDAGADFIVTQFFYDVEVYLDYVARCRAAGITCPIVPGVMPIQNYTLFRRMTSFCRTRVPAEMWEQLAPIKEDEEAVRRWGVSFLTKLCRRLLDADVTPNLIHFYTLNLEKSVRLILESLGLTATASIRRQFPWRSSKLSSRAGEDVRPINWANRPKSYLSRTEEWDEFPNGRWGDGRSPAFGELSDYQFVDTSLGSREDRRAMWGEAPLKDVEVFEAFIKYVRAEIPLLPWCEVPLQAETGTISADLVKINKAGFLTINSQPAVNGALSDDAVFGWGGAGGRVYQKAYVECFTSQENLKLLMELCEKKPNLHYYAVDVAGNTYSNGSKKATALTWGVFPQCEILQPTIFDPNTFLVWKNEAFQLWTSIWASIYDDESASNALIHKIHDTYFLVAIIDNDFSSTASMWSVFREIIDEKEGTPLGGSQHHPQYSLP